MAQTAGDVMAAISMQVIPVFFNTDYDPDDLGTCKRRLHYFFSKPYNLSFIILTWIIWNLGMMSPWLPVAIVSQVFMGTSYVSWCRPCDGLDSHRFCAFWGSPPAFSPMLQVQARGIWAHSIILDNTDEY